MKRLPLLLVALAFAGCSFDSPWRPVPQNMPELLGQGTPVSLSLGPGQMLTLAMNDAAVLSIIQREATMWDAIQHALCMLGFGGLLVLVALGIAWFYSEHRLSKVAAGMLIMAGFLVMLSTLSQSAIEIDLKRRTVQRVERHLFGLIENERPKYSLDRYIKVTYYVNCNINRTRYNIDKTPRPRGCQNYVFLEGKGNIRYQIAKFSMDEVEGAKSKDILVRQHVDTFATQLAKLTKLRLPSQPRYGKVP